MICIGRHVRGRHPLARQHGGKTTLYRAKRLIVTLGCAVNVSTSSFQHFPLKFKCKICVQKEAIHNSENHILITNLLILRKWCGFEKPNHYYFV